MAILTTPTSHLSPRAAAILDVRNIVDVAITANTEITASELAEEIMEAIEAAMNKTRQIASYEVAGSIFGVVCKELADYNKNAEEWDVSESGAEILTEVEVGFRKVWTTA